MVIFAGEMMQCTKCGKNKNRVDGFYWSNGRPMRQCKDCKKQAASARQQAAKRNPTARTTNPKRCAKCEKTKPARAFNSKKSSNDGLRSYCKDCENADNKRGHAKRGATLDYPPTTKPKTCSVCGETKRAARFNVNRTLSSGRVAQCKDCERDYRQSRNFPRQNHPKVCANCGPPKLPNWMFGNSPYHTDGLEPRCKVCIHKKSHNRDGDYTGHDYLRVHKKQGGRCRFYHHAYPCNDTGNGGLHIDHDHDTGEMRGLLCLDHNRTIIGRIEDLAPKEVYELLEYTGKLSGVLREARRR